jgi:hypothetical protein
MLSLGVKEKTLEEIMQGNRLINGAGAYIEHIQPIAY